MTAHTNDVNVTTVVTDDTPMMSPADRVRCYFLACSEGTADEIASPFTTDAVVFDTNVQPARGRHTIGVLWTEVRDRWQGARWMVDSVVTDGAPHPSNGR